MFLDHQLNPKRSLNDCMSLFSIRGPKFNLSNDEKEAIYQLEKEDLFWLKKNHQINYLRTMPIKENIEEYLYTPALCEEIKKAFSNSNGIIRERMIDFFKNKTNTEKFLQIKQGTFINQLESRALVKVRKNQIPKRKNQIKKTLLFIKSILILKKTELFNTAYYLNHYPDVPKNAAIHFLTQGARENKNPSKHFSTQYYSKMNQDVLESGINPLVHYILYGKKEGREKRSVIDRINFLLCGMKDDKANGLFELLIGHPEIEVPLVALHFFDNDDFFKNQLIR